MDYKSDWLGFIKQSLGQISRAEVSFFVQHIFECLDPETTLVIPMANNKYKVLPIEDIMYITEKQKGRIAIVTVESSYMYSNEACDIYEFLQKNHKHFLRMGSGLMVNILYVRAYDSYLRRVFFSDTHFINSTGLAINKLKKFFGTDYDLNKTTLKTVGEYSPKANKNKNQCSIKCDKKA